MEKICFGKSPEKNGAISTHTRRVCWWGLEYMPSKFVYKCKLAGSTTDIYLCDLENVKELYLDGAIVTCRRYNGEVWIVIDIDGVIHFQMELASKVIHQTGNGEFPIEFQLSIYDQCNRDIRMCKINSNGNNHQPATSKQKKLMDDLGIDYEKDVDIKTASRLIGETLNK